MRGRQRERHVTVKQRVDRRNRQRQPVVGELGELAAGGTIQRRVGGHHHQHRVPHRRSGRGWACQQQRRRVEVTPLGVACAGKDLTAAADDVPERVVDHQRAHRGAVRQTHGGRSDPTRTRQLRACQLAHRRAGPGPQPPLERSIASLGIRARRVPIGRAGTASGEPTPRSKRIAAGTMGTGRIAGREARSAFRQPGHHPVRGGQPERGSAGQADGVDPIDECGGAEQVGLARSRRRAAHVHAGHRSVGRQRPRCSRSGPQRRWRGRPGCPAPSAGSGAQRGPSAATSRS